MKMGIARRATLFLGLLVALLIAAGTTAHQALPIRGNTATDVALRTVDDSYSVHTLLPDGRTLSLDTSGTVLRILDTHTARLTQAWNLPETRRFASLSVLPSGRVLIWGGMDSSNALPASGLWFDPSAQTLTAAKISLLPRAGHTATVMTDGRLLVAGGWSSQLGALPETELWDERSNVSTLLQSELVPPRLGHNAQLQADGRVRLFGGQDAQHRPIVSDTVFDPVNQKFVHATVASPEVSDTTVPQLAASIPQINATNVSPTTRLALRFTLPLRMVELNETTVILMGPQNRTSAQVVPAEQGRLLFVTPRQDLFPDSKYTLLIAGVHSRQGQLLPLLAIDFRTAALAPVGRISMPIASHTGSSPVANASPVDAPERVITGSPQDTRSTTNCQTTNAINYLCRLHSTMDEGIWSPGRDNADGHWRLYSQAAPLPQLDMATAIANALGITGITGNLTRIDGVPVANVAISIGNHFTRTDAQGNFTVYNPPAGRQELFVDGSTANAAGIEYGQFVVGVDVHASKLTQLLYRMFLPRISARDKIQIASPLTRDLVITHPDMPGVEIQIPAGTVIRDRKGHLVTELALVPTPVNRAPFPVIGNAPQFFTVEPGGAVVQSLTPRAAQGIKIIYPNYDHEPVGTQSDFWIYEPMEGWRVYGQGRVTEAGLQFVPEPGVALHETMGAMHNVNNSDPGTENHPPDGNHCRKPGCGDAANTADPVDLLTGEFVYSDTDIAINDVMPLQLERSYRPHDLIKREFGIGTASNFSYHLNGSNQFAATIDLVLPNGTSILFSQVALIGSDHNDWLQKGSHTEFNGALLRATADGSGFIFLLTLRNGEQWNFSATASTNNLQWMQDRFGNQINLTYDAGFLSRIYSPSGRYVQFAYDTSNRIHTATDNAGHAWIYDYDANGLLVTVTYPDTTYLTYTYKTVNSRHLIESITDRRRIRRVFNEFETIGGRVVKQTLADNTYYTIQYNHSNGTNVGVLVTSPDGNQRRVVFGSGSLYPVSDTLAYGTPLAQTYVFERQPSSDLITARTDALGRRTEYQYDSVGRITHVTELVGTPQARSTVSTYTPNGDLATITDPLGHVTTLAYTNRCLTSITNSIGKVTTITCNAAGQPISVSDALGHSMQMQYLGTDLSAVIDPLNRVTSIHYDSLGRPTVVQDPQGRLTRRDYDVMGRVKTSYDSVGNTTVMGYDGNDNATSVALPNASNITYVYDVLNRLTDRHDGLNQLEHWTYWPMDRVKTYADRKNQTTMLAYDSLGRPTTVSYADATLKTATYDAGNRLLSLTDSVSGALSWTYDGLFDRVQTAITPQGTIGYSYDAADRRVGMTPAMQSPVTYQYDNANRLTQILQGTETVGFGYDDANRLTQTTLPNGIQGGYAYNNANQVTGIAWVKPNNSAVADLGYAYDSAGIRNAQTGSLASQNLPPASTGTNVFDANNRQTKFNGQALTYDANGNLIGDGVRTYIWNARDQLVQIKQGASVIASFTYDALDRRIGRTEAGTTTAYLHDGLNPVQETKGGIVNPILTGLGIDQRFARNDTGGRTYFLTDALGSTRALTNSADAIVQRYDYDPYGNTTSTQSTFTNPYQYTGRERDASGLYFYRARYYQPTMGRFISEDPIKLGGGLNSYAYVGGNPLSFSDPQGLAMSPLRECGGSMAHCGDPPPPPAPECGRGNRSRNNNPNLSNNVVNGALIGLGVSAVVVANIVGFPEVEAGEATALWGTGGATTVALLDGIAGEPILSRILVPTLLGSPGLVVGGAVGYGVTTPMSAPPPSAYPAPYNGPNGP